MSLHGGVGTVFSSAVSALREANAEFMVVGATAFGMLTLPRATYDLNFVIGDAPRASRPHPPALLRRGGDARPLLRPACSRAGDRGQRHACRGLHRDALVHAAGARAEADDALGDGCWRRARGDG